FAKPGIQFICPNAYSCIDVCITKCVTSFAIFYFDFHFPLPVSTSSGKASIGKGFCSYHGCYCGYSHYFLSWVVYCPPRYHHRIECNIYYREGALGVRQSTRWGRRYLGGRAQ